jgi:hypothetical protein
MLNADEAMELVKEYMGDGAIEGPGRELTGLSPEEFGKLCDRLLWEEFGEMRLPLMVYTKMARLQARTFIIGAVLTKLQSGK